MERKKTSQYLFRPIKQAHIGVILSTMKELDLPPNEPH